MQMRVDGKSDDALTLLDEVVEDDPQNVAALLLRAEWLLQESQADRALADLDRAVEISPDDRDLLRIRATVLLTVGRYDDAIRDTDTALASVATEDHIRRSMYLNLSAYYRAIANQELTRAKEDIDEALKLVQDEDSRMALLDTRGFVLYRMERYDEALADLNAAIPVADKELEQWDQMKATISRRGHDIEAMAKKVYRNVAVIYYHRGLIYEALGQKEQAEADFAKVRGWGLEPGEDLF